MYLDQRSKRDLQTDHARRTRPSCLQRHEIIASPASSPLVSCCQLVERALCKVWSSPIKLAAFLVHDRGSWYHLIPSSLVSLVDKDQKTFFQSSWLGYCYWSSNIIACSLLSFEPRNHGSTTQRNDNVLTITTPTTTTCTRSSHC